MQQLPKTYNPKIAESTWYTYWLQNGFFNANAQSKKVPYTIVMPPPNITGTLHMGHILNNTIQDVLIRKARMEGQEACWIPGIDHASIATEAKIVTMLKEQGLSKRAIGRQKFLRYAWEWKEKYGTIILEQLKKLGISCDWNRTRFTLEDSLSKAVQEAFIKLYEQGYIYQGKRMIHWDPKGETALSDDEVYYKSITSRLYYIRYAIENSHNNVIIATTRPETILGDTALCIHPDDLRYQNIRGTKAIVPLINRVIPIIEDNYVDRTFGTGCLKVTPAHDINDYLLGQKHALDIIDIFNSDGTLNKSATCYVGEDRFVARQKIVQQLQEEGKIEKVEEYIHNVGLSERTHAVVEPRLSTQWFVAMQDLAKPAHDCVLNENIQFYPPKFKKNYQTWMANIKDWCISRQLWWGHSIPAYYLADGSVLVAKNINSALEKAKQKTNNTTLTITDLKQDEDVLDTWFSSWLWPISVLEGLQNPDNEDINYFYPTDTLVTAPDIIFFWVARMIMAGYIFKKTLPFKNVYFTGIVRDTIGKKMSKSLGNSPDPLKLIEQHGADSVRIGMLFSTPAGNDLLFSPHLCEQGKRFLNKIWNSFRLIQSWKIHNEPTTDDQHDIAILWFHAKFNQIFSVIADHFFKFRISDALMSIYKLIWDDFCSWYLEMIKPTYGKPIAQNVYDATRCFFEDLLKLLHPFAPFITEELWHQLRLRKQKECIMTSSWPVQQDYDTTLIENASFAFSLITQIRNIRNELQLPTKKLLTLYSITPQPLWLTQFMLYIQKIGNVQYTQIDHNEPEYKKKTFHIGGQTFDILLHQQVENINREAEQKQQKISIAYLQGLLAKVMEKLNNEHFLNNAPPAVITKERKKQLDIEKKLSILQQQIVP